MDHDRNTAAAAADRWTSQRIKPAAATASSAGLTLHQWNRIIILSSSASASIIVDPDHVLRGWLSFPTGFSCFYDCSACIIPSSEKFFDAVSDTIVVIIVFVVIIFIIVIIHVCFHSTSQSTLSRKSFLFPWIPLMKLVSHTPWGPRCRLAWCKVARCESYYYGCLSSVSPAS